MSKYYEEYIPEIKDYIRNHSTECFQPATVKGYICPICGSGSGPKGTGMTSKEGIYFTCWRGCFTHLDVFDIMGLKYNTNTWLSKIKAAANELGINFQLPQDYTKTMSYVHTTPPTKPVQRIPKDEPEVDFTDFFTNAHKDVWKTKYHRGLSNKTLNKYNIGYCRRWRHPKVPKAPYSPRLIIPTSKYSYLARDTRSELNEQQKGYAKIKVGKMHLFNAEYAIKTNKPIFIVEGEFDALSIIDVGAQAIALGSVSNYKKLIDFCISNNISNTIILALDNDQAGKETSDKIMLALQENHIKCTICNITDKYKDPNEIFMNDKAKFVKLLYMTLKKLN